MRTTIDMPDDLLRKAKVACAHRNMTFRGLVIDALQRSLEERSGPFRLREAAAGAGALDNPLSPSIINEAIDRQRETGATY